MNVEVPHVVLICGGRDWKNRNLIRSKLEELQAQHGLRLLVVEGGAPGADTIAREECHDLGIDVVTVWANWKGRSKVREDGGISYWAGPYRNRLMAQLLVPAEAFAYHPMIQRSKGTKDMVEVLRDRGVPVSIIAS